jgi:hypothetical protein
VAVVAEKIAEMCVAEGSRDKRQNTHGHNESEKHYRDREFTGKCVASGTWLGQSFVLF